MQQLIELFLQVLSNSSEFLHVCLSNNSKGEFKQKINGTDRISKAKELMTIFKVSILVSWPAKFPWLQLYKEPMFL